VSYTNNKGTNAGTYNATATLSGANYVTKTLNAVLTINKAEITGITFEDKTVTYDENEHVITVSGTLPKGVSVSYTDNKGTKVGTYNAVATLSGANYETKILEAKLVIKIDLSKVAQTIWESVSQRPEPWSFIPEALRPENMAYTTAPVSDFTSFVNVSSIGKKPIGRQFNVLYDGLTDATKMLGYFDSVYTVGGTIANLYQTFINKNPDNYRTFEFDPGEAGGFHGKITLNDNLYELLIGNGTVSLELTYNIETGLRVGRIQATDGMVLKYESTENKLDLAIKTTVAGVGNLKQIHFLRDENGNMNGYYYEYTGTTNEDGKGFKTSAAIFSNATKLVVVSDKKELQDLQTNACEEVYNAVTGEYIGSEVDETVKSIAFDTLWFMLPNVNGINTIKVDPKANKENPDTIYINGKSEAIQTKLVGGLSLKTASRRFDIEMRDVWYVIEVQDGDKVKYETQKISIPMLFVQKEQTGTFTADFQEKNSVTASLKSTDITNITNDYEATSTLYKSYKEKSSVEQVEAFIGNKNSYFDE
ncbi:MAG: MBG domain-containing protein, partial [Clostridia bacterium]|nr:MBG domain-containing protein [Clostridia bacterium]